MTVQNTNPLASYFRMPGLNVTLPTGGAFLPEGTFDANPDGTVPIYPMTAADEYLLKNPDALLSGFAIQKMLESCVPAIKNVSLISTPDLDVLLLAIRAVTYGNTMEVSTQCPKCTRANDYQADLPSLLQTVKSIPAENSVRLTDDLVVFLRPYSFNNATQVSLLTYNETRRLQGIEQGEGVTQEVIDQERRISMQKIVALQSRILADCIVKVNTPTGDVSEPEHIAEFMANISRAWVSKMEAEIIKIMELGMDKTLPVKCQAAACGHEWNTQIEFDPSNFFE